MFDLISLLRSMSDQQGSAQGQVQDQQQKPMGMLFQQWNPANQYMPKISLLGGAQKPAAPEQFGTGSIPGIQTPQGGFFSPRPKVPGGITGKGGATGGGG